MEIASGSFFPFQDKRCPSSELNRATWILTDAAQTTQFPSFRDGCINKQEEGSRPFGKEFVESSPPQLAPSLGEVFDYIRNDGVLPGIGERG